MVYKPVRLTNLTTTVFKRIKIGVFKLYLTVTHGVNNIKETIQLQYVGIILRPDLCGSRKTLVYELLCMLTF